MQSLTIIHCLYCYLSCKQLAYSNKLEQWRPNIFLLSFETESYSLFRPSASLVLGQMEAEGEQLEVEAVSMLFTKATGCVQWPDRHTAGLELVFDQGLGMELTPPHAAAARFSHNHPSLSLSHGWDWWFQCRPKSLEVGKLFLLPSSCTISSSWPLTRG